MERLKEVFLLFPGHAYSRVLKCYSRSAILCRCYLYRQCAPLGHSPESVLREIPEDLFELVRISVDCDLRYFRPQDYGVHLPDFGVVFQQGTGIAQQRNQFDRVLGLLAGPRKAKKVLNELVQPVAFPEHDVHKTGVPLLQRQTGAQDLRRASN